MSHGGREHHPQSALPAVQEAAIDVAGVVSPVGLFHFQPFLYGIESCLINQRFMRVLHHNPLFRRFEIHPLVLERPGGAFLPDHPSQIDRVGEQFFH